MNAGASDRTTVKRVRWTRQEDGTYIPLEEDEAPAPKAMRRPADKMRRRPADK